MKYLDSADCDVMKYFWVKWVDGELFFGQGLQAGTGTLGIVSSSDIRSDSFYFMTTNGTIENQCREFTFFMSGFAV